MIYIKKNFYLILYLIFYNIYIFSNSDYKFLIFGANGWIGSKLVNLLYNDGYIVIKAQSRLENRESILNEILQYKPNFVINAAGVTGRPNVDWCEDHKQDTIRANIIGALNLADICYLYNIHMTNFGTGCIYEYDEHHPINSLIGFKEDDEPNFDRSFYSKTKIMLDKLLQNYPNVLNLRLRMPISDDLHPRNFITKITKYEKVINIPNSMSVLYDLLPIAIDMTLKNMKGNFNFVNPGVISHNEILDLYKKYIDKNFNYQNFSIEEQKKDT
jgi:3,5-epimerase/4-reductase